MSRDFSFGGAACDGHGTRFRAFVTSSTECALRLFDSDSLAVTTTLPMQAGPGSIFETFVAGVGPGALYKFVIDGRELPDPYARFLPHGVHGPAMVVKSVEGDVVPCRRPLPLSEQVIYELHVGTFTEQGTYRAASARLDELANLGVTTLDLMPLSAFAGQRGWGYDGVAHFAPFAPYGSPDDLRAFIVAAHERGLSVLLDVVYNHFGPAGNYLGSFSPRYFDASAPTPWGPALDFSHPAVRAYVLENARYWFEEFGFDGLRLDAVHAMRDESPRHVLRELSELAARFVPPKLLIAEDDRNDPAGVEELGLDAQWADDFHHQLRVTLTGERDGYYGGYVPGVAELGRTVEGGWLYQGQRTPGEGGQPRGKPAERLPASAFVYCIQNHDQIGNRALGDRLHHRISMEEYALASAVLLFLPMTPLLFMGQEWATTSPFLFFTDHEADLGTLISQGRRDEFRHFSAFADRDARAQIPDPQALTTFQRSRLRWDERNRRGHHDVLELYRALLNLRREDPVLRSSTRAQLAARSVGDVLVLMRWQGSARRALLANFGAHRVDFASFAGLSRWSELEAGRGRVLLDTLAFVGEASATASSEGKAAIAPHQTLILELPAGEESAP